MAKRDEVIENLDATDEQVVMVTQDVAELVDEFLQTSKQLNLKKLTNRKLRRTIPVLKNILEELESVA